jgi:hypothetical protein
MGQVRGLRHAVAAELPSLRTPLKLADAELRLIRVRKADTSAAQLPSGAAFGVTLIGRAISSSISNPNVEGSIAYG